MKKFIPIFLFLSSLSIDVQSADIKAPNRLEKAMNEAMGWGRFVPSIMENEGEKNKTRICELNKKESSRYNPASTPEELHSEIKYFVRIQEQYVKPMMRDQKSSGGEVCGSDCLKGREFQKCLMGLAERRKKAIDNSARYGFSCFQKFEDGYVYLNSNIVNLPLETPQESMEAQLASIEKDRKFVCGTEVVDSSRQSCLKRIATRLKNISEYCPQNASAATASRAGGSRSSSGSGSR